MLLGLLLLGRGDHPHRQRRPAVASTPPRSLLPLVLPLLVPLAVLSCRSSTWCSPSCGAPGAGQSPFAPDKQHLHHRLLRSGTPTAGPSSSCTSGRRCSSFGAVGLSVTGGRAELLVAAGVLIVVGVVVVQPPAPGGPRARRGPPSWPRQRERSRAEHPTARALRRRLTARAPARRPAAAGRPAGGSVTSAPSALTPWDPSFLRRARSSPAPSRGGRRAGGRSGRRLVQRVSAWSIGALVVTTFFCLSGFVIAWAGGHRRRPDPPRLALGTFLVKAPDLLRRAQRTAGRRLGRPARPGLESPPPPCSGAPSRPAGCGPASCTTCRRLAAGQGGAGVRQVPLTDPEKPVATRLR